MKSDYRNFGLSEKGTQGYLRIFYAPDFDYLWAESVNGSIWIREPYKPWKKIHDPGMES